MIDIVMPASDSGMDEVILQTRKAVMNEIVLGDGRDEEMKESGILNDVTVSLNLPILPLALQITSLHFR